MRTSDSLAVSSLLRESFAGNLAPFMAYTQHGVADFLAIQLEYSTSFSARQLLVATDMEDCVVGFADFRSTSPVDAFLSQICVAPPVRGRGIAAKLIEFFLAANPEVDIIALDVFVNNVAAQKLYERLGFVAVTSRLWLSRPLPAPSSALAVEKVQTVVAAHNAFGFCEFSVAWTGQQVCFGRIGRSVLRCWDVGTFAHDELIAAVGSTFSGLSQAMVIVSADARVPSDAKVLVEAHRMQRSSIVALGPAKVS